MDTLLILKAIVMGLVEGATEFLPVSSTGHLILAKHWLDMQSVSDVLEIVIQPGAILAVCLVYFQKLWQTAVRLPFERRAQNFTLAVLLGFLPAAVIGVLAHDFIKEKLFNDLTVSLALIVGGIIILIIERMKLQPKVLTVDELPLKTAFKIGIIQCVAMIPGVSRSGATIMGALCLGVERKVAAEFSFFLAIPTLLGASVLDLYKGWDGITSSDWVMIGVGFVASFISALIVIKAFIAFISKHDFTVFAWYRIVLGIAMLVLLV